MHQGRTGHRRRGVRGAIAVGLAALVAGCAGATKLYARWLSPIYTVPEYNYAAGRKDFFTVVEGDPFGMGEAEFEEAVIAVLNRFEPRPQPTTFTDELEEAARPLYRTVLVFEAPAAMTPTAICAAGYGAEPVGLERAQREPVRVAAAYCRGGGALSSVIGEVGGVESVTDPGFVDLISQIVLVLFPLEGEEDDDGCAIALGGGC